MLDISVLSEAKPREQDWQDRIQDGLVGYFQSVAQNIVPEGHEDALRFDRMKSSRDVLSLRVRNGDAAALLILFDGVGIETWQAYRRARKILSELSTSGLTPEVVAYSDPRRFILLKDVEQSVRSGSERVENDDKTAFQLGQWLGHVDALSPQQAACGNWFDYLSKTVDQTGFKPSGRAAEKLCAIPVCGLGLARDLAALDYVSISPAGTMVGWDFDQTAMRPRGWDYVLTYRALLQRLRAKGASILTALSDGFASAHVGGLMVDELNGVARSLATLR